MVIACWLRNKVSKEKITGGHVAGFDKTRAPWQSWILPGPNMTGTMGKKPGTAKGGKRAQSAVKPSRKVVASVEGNIYGAQVPHNPHPGFYESSKDHGH